MVRMEVRQEVVLALGGRGKGEAIDQEGCALSVCVVGRMKGTVQRGRGGRDNGCGWGSATHKQTRTSTHLMRSMLVAMGTPSSPLLRLFHRSSSLVPLPSSYLSLVLLWDVRPDALMRSRRSNRGRHDTRHAREEDVAPACLHQTVDCDVKRVSFNRLRRRSMLLLPRPNSAGGLSRVSRGSLSGEVSRSR